MFFNGSASEGSRIASSEEVATFLAYRAARRKLALTSELTELEGRVDVNAAFIFKNTIERTVNESNLTAFLLLTSCSILTPCESCINVTTMRVGSNQLAGLSEISAVVFTAATTTLIKVSEFR